MLPEEISSSRVRPGWSGLGLSAYESEQKSADRVQELNTDLKLLLECLKYHEQNPDILKDGLLTVSSICLENSQAQDYFRDSGGLNFVLNLLTTCNDETVVESAMYTLGCATERNVFSQKKLCSKAVFRFLECKLVDGRTSSKLKQTVAYLLLCLVSNNSTAQSLINSSHCLDALLDIFRCQYPGHRPSTDSHNNDWVDRSTNPERDSSTELWKTVTSTLIGCVNNPQNDTNQRECTSVFPVALQILSDTKDPQVIRLLASFLSLTADNNGRIQDRLGMLGAMDIIVNAFQTVVESLVQAPAPEYTDAAMQLASLLVSCVTDNMWNKLTLADLRVVPLLVQLLSLDVIETEVKLKIVLTLGQLTDGCELSQKQLVECDGLGLIVHIMTGQQDEEFTKAATYLLHTCVRVVNSSDDRNISRNMQLPQHPLPFHGTKQKRQKQNVKIHSYPEKKPQIKRNKMPSPRKRPISEEDEQESVLSLKTKSQKTKNDEKQDTSTPHTNQINPDEKDTAESITNGTTVEALYNEISTRKELEIKLQKEIKAREDLEAENLKLEKREEERVTAENVTKEKTQALTKELERQYMMVVSKPDQQDQDIARTDSDTKVCDTEKVDSKSAPNKSQEKQNTSQQSPSDVKILEQKVDELQKQLKEHITHNSDHLSEASTCSIASSTIEKASSIKRRRSINGERSPQSVASRSVSSRKSTKKVAKSLFQSPSEEASSTSQSTKMSRQKRAPNLYQSPSEEGSSASQSTKASRQKRTPNLRHATNPHFSQPIFRLPSSTITRNHRVNREQSTPVNKQAKQTSEKKCRPTYAEEVLPYKLQKHNSPLELPKHRAPSTSNDEEDDDLESILSDLTDSYSVADSNVSMSDVMLNLPVRVASRKSKIRRRERSKHGSRKPHSVQSSAGSQRSKRSFTIKFQESLMKDKERQSVSLTSPSSSKSALNCPGCDPPINRPLITSRNFLYTLEKSRHTCPEHRELHKLIKDDINLRKKMQDQYEELKTRDANSRHSTRYSSRRTADEPVHQQQQHQPEHQQHQTSHNGQIKHRDEYDYTTGEENTPKYQMHTLNESEKKPRRKRQDFSEEEIHNLMTGVKKCGKHWNFILWSYTFKSGRTAVDLKDKYRRLQTQNVPGILPKTPAKHSKRQLQWN